MANLPQLSLHFSTSAAPLGRGWWPTQMVVAAHV